MRAVAITILVFLSILALPLLFERERSPQPSDSELRRAALEHNLLPVPKEREEMKMLYEKHWNVIDEKRVALGRKLFFDTRLSKEDSVSCASCHLLDEGGDDNRPTAIGYHGRANPFHLNSPTVLNASLAKREFWDARAKDVEEQARGPITAPFEMNMSPDELIAKLKKTEYPEEFEEVFGKDSLDFDNLCTAIGAYERTLLTRSSFDDFLDGNDSALSPKAKKGLHLFIDRGCKGCHTGMGVGGLLVKRFPLRKYLPDYMGIDLNDGISLKKDEIPFDNVGGFKGRNGSYFFRVPILRNVALTSPYFHNGAIKELKEAIRIMSKYQLGDEFDDEEIAAVEAFLKSLSGKIVDYGY
jgi:cytochrome c peroxidase